MRGWPPSHPEGGGGGSPGPPSVCWPGRVGFALCESLVVSGQREGGRGTWPACEVLAAHGGTAGTGGGSWWRSGVVGSGQGGGRGHWMPSWRASSLGAPGPVGPLSLPLEQRGVCGGTC